MMNIVDTFLFADLIQPSLTLCFLFPSCATVVKKSKKKRKRKDA